MSLPSLVGLAIDGKFDRNPKLTNEQKKWLDDNWSSYTYESKGPPIEKKWRNIKPKGDDYELLQLAKDAARHAQPPATGSDDASSDSGKSSSAASGSATSGGAIASEVPKVRARALLRATFGAKWWSFESDGKTTELHRARMKWAMSVVSKLDFDPLNLPEPPPEIWGTWKPKQDDGAMLPFAGPITGIRSTGQSPDGLEIVVYVKKQQEAFVVGTPTGSQSIITKVFDTSFMKEQSEIIVNVFKEFIKDVNDMGKQIEDIIGKDNVSKLYTAGSGRFNRTLRIPPAIWKPYPDPSNNQERVQRAQQVWKPLHVKDPYAPELVTFEAFKKEGLARVHAMWRLLYIAPRITWQPVYLLRAVTSSAYLPHSLAGVSNPQPGVTFLDVGFVSTTVASAEEYWTPSQLAVFFNKASKCCLIAIEAMPGMPMLPLFVEPSASVYQKEREVVLPPLTKWTYLGFEVRTSLHDTRVYSYRVTM